MRSLLLDGLGQLDISDLRCRVPEKSEVNADLQIASCKAKRALQHMEGNDRSTKRLKLSLEPDIGHTAVDIKDNGQEIYKRYCKSALGLPEFIPHSFVSLTQ